MNKEILEFIWKNKKWWLLPPAIVLIGFGLLVAFSSVSPVGAFIYTIF